VKKAIFYRDRGKCSFCLKDLTNLISITSEKNFDHIVPLALGGINDVTNFQLLCETCNKSKRHFNAETSIIYEKWY
jgi:5-methylcytosine-specific restriction endonuclease McrA